jgi:3-oxoacyl-[acyl-carrier-protein] synthase II
MSAAVITGVGVVSPFGFGAVAFFDALEQGRSAVGQIRSFDASRFPTRVAAEVPIQEIRSDWLISHLSPGSKAQSLVEELASDAVFRDRKVAFGLIAACEAWRSAGCGGREQEAWLSIALGLEQAFLQDFAPLLNQGEIDWSREESSDLPKVRFRSPLDGCSRALARLLELKGPVIVHASACAAGCLAVTHGASLIERGMTSIVLCGGADSMVNPLGIGGFSRLGAPSPRNEPDACRPFDRRRDGLAIGEGSAMFVLESEDRARARGARGVARVLGWGSTQDAYRATAPRPDGVAAQRAMERAIERADLPREAIGYINAHGTGTPLNDPAECRAIHGAFRKEVDNIQVSSIKGAVGHLMAASGAIELASCLLPFQRGLLPGTAHHQQPDPDCDVQVIGEKPIRASVDFILSNSFGFGGQNASVVLGRVQ